MGRGELKKGGRDGGRIGGDYDPALCCSISFKFSVHGEQQMIFFSLRCMFLIRLIYAAILRTCNWWRQQKERGTS